MLTSVVFAIVGDHEHHFPFEDVVVHQPAADAGYVFVRLHVLELPAEQPRRGGCG